MAANVSVPPFDVAPTFVVGASSVATFYFGFPFVEPADIVVKVNGVALNPAAYTVHGHFVQNGTTVEGGYGSGTVILNTPVASVTVTVDRDVKPIRQTQFSKAASLPMSSLNADMNRRVMETQDARRNASAPPPAAGLEPGFADLLFPTFYQANRYPGGVSAPNAASLGAATISAANAGQNDIAPHLAQMVAAAGGVNAADVTAWWRGGQKGLGYAWINDAVNYPATGGYFGMPLEKTFGFYHYQGRDASAHTVFETMSENHCSERLSTANGTAPMSQWRSANEGRTYGVQVHRQKTSQYTGVSRYNMFLVHINEGTKDYAEHGGLYVACRSVPGIPDPNDGNNPTPATSKFHSAVFETSNYANTYYQSAPGYPDTAPNLLTYPYAQLSGKRGTYPNALVGVESDIVTRDWQSLAYEHIDYMAPDLGYGFASHHKHAYTAVVFGGGRGLAGYGIFNPGYRPIGPHPNVAGSSEYGTGYWLNGVLAHAYSIDPNEGRFLNCLSPVCFLLRINGPYTRVKEAAIDIQPQIPFAGNVGVRIGTHIARPMELQADKAIWFNAGATGGGTQYIAYQTTENAIVIGGKLSLPTVGGSNHANDAAAATAGVPIFGLYHNAGGVRMRIT